MPWLKRSLESRFAWPVAAALLGILLAAFLVQTFRIEGLRVWPIHVTGFKDKIAAVEKSLSDTKAAFATTVANYRAAADRARRLDAENVARVKAEQAQINERVAYDYQKRIAAARADAERLRARVRGAGTHKGSAGAASVSCIPAASTGSAQASCEDGFSVADRLTATEQAIQLDELIKWVRHQAGVDVNGNTVAVPPANGTATVVTLPEAKQ